MTGLVLAFVGIIAVWLVLKAGLIWIRRYNARYQLYAAAANEFYAAADRLIENKNTPDDVLEFVGGMNEAVNFPHTALFFVRMIQRRKGRTKATALFDLRTMPQDVVADFVIASSSWIDAIAYRGMVFGPIFRMYLDSKSSITGETAAVVERIHHNQRHALPA